LGSHVQETETTKNNDMKSLLINTSLILLAATLLTACKRRDKETEEQTSTQEATASADEARVSENSDEAADDAINMFSASSLSGGRIGLNAVCGATVDSANLGVNKTVTLTFDGTTPCVNGTRTRSGSITAVLTMGAKWKDMGSVITLTFTNYKVTRISDGKYVTFNGTKTITNVNGGLISQLPTTVTSVTHRIQATGLSMKFDDGSSRTWNTDRTRVITKSGSDYQASVTGNGSAGGHSNLAFWGVNRFGGAFYTEISSAIVVNTCSSQGRALAISGTKIHYGALVDITVTFGVNANGDADGTCSAYGYKVSWVNNQGDAKSAVLSY
jgi:hypothetical protein